MRNGRFIRMKIATNEPRPEAQNSYIDAFVERGRDDRIDQLTDEIKWNERRLANLVLSWEDQQQTMDLLCDLRAELHELMVARHAA